MKYLIKKILTESTDLDTMGEVLTREVDFEVPEAQRYLKLFGNDMADVYHYLDGKGYGDDFLQNLRNNVYRGLMLLVDALQIQHPKMSKEDKELFHEWILPTWLKDHSRDFPYDVQETGKIIYQLDKGDEADFFSGDNDIRAYAEVVFEPNSDMLEFYEWMPDHEEEDLIEYLDRQNFMRMVLWFLKKYEGKVVKNWREEFEQWVEEDGIDDESFYVTPHRIHGFLSGSLEDAKYNWAVFLTHLDDLDDVDELFDHMKWVWRDSWNLAQEEEYYKVYKDAFQDFIGKLYGETDTHRYYDATELFEDLFYRASKAGEEPGNETISELLLTYIGDITPKTPSDPSLSKVNEYYNENVDYLFK